MKFQVATNWVLAPNKFIEHSDEVKERHKN